MGVIVRTKKQAEPGGTPDRSRTYDTQLRKLVLYPLSYGRIQGHYSVKVGKCKGSCVV